MGSQKNGFKKDDDDDDLHDELLDNGDVIVESSDNEISAADDDNDDGDNYSDPNYLPESEYEDVNDSDSESTHSLRLGRIVENSEDDILKLIRSNDGDERLRPPDIVNDNTVADISFSPTCDVIAVGTIEGDIVLYRYDVENVELILKYSAHMGSCRQLEYSDDGGLVYSISDDKCIIVADAENGKFKNAFDEAHQYAIYSLVIINSNLLSTGDDEGVVKLWDRRKRDEVFSIKIGTEYVSSLKCLDEASTLVCTAGDGIVSAVNMNGRRISSQSHPYNAELTCCDIFCSNTKLAVGTSTGSLLLYSWGQFSSWNDEFPGLDEKKSAINCMIPVTENIVVTGLDNGLMRATNLFPMRHVGIVGQHDSTVERIDINKDGTLLASSSIGNNVRFWNVEYFEDIHITDKMTANNLRAREHNLPSSYGVNSVDFFSGLT